MPYRALSILAAGFVALNPLGYSTAQAQKVVYDPPQRFGDTVNQTCPDELRVLGDLFVDEKDGYVSPAATMTCRPVFRPTCLIVPFRDEKATLVFDVDPTGRSQNVRLVSTTNACLDNNAALSILLSEFEASPNGGSNLSRTVRFEFDSRNWELFDEPLNFEFKNEVRCRWQKNNSPNHNWRSRIGLSPQTLKQCPPKYPDRCQSRAAPWEGVLVHYDVAPDGRIENIRVPAATNKCFARNAARSVAAWRYMKSETRWVDLSTVVTFQLVRQ